MGIHTQVRCAVLRLLAALWQHPACAPRAVQALRGNAHLWHLVEDVLLSSSPTPAAAATSSAVAPSPLSAQSAAYAWQVVSLEAARYPRAKGATRAAAAGGGGGSERCWAVVDKVVSKGLVAKVRKKVLPAQRFQFLPGHGVACKPPSAGSLGARCGQARSCRRRSWSIRVSIRASTRARRCSFLHGLSSVP